MSAVSYGDVKSKEIGFFTIKKNSVKREFVKQQ